jgi:hypothetical protein
METHIQTNFDQITARKVALFYRPGASGPGGEILNQPLNNPCPNRNQNRVIRPNLKFICNSKPALIEEIRLSHLTGPRCLAEPFIK